MMTQTLAGLGRATRDVGKQMADLYRIAIRVTIIILTFRYSARATLEQMYEIGNRSVLFITVTLGMLGFISVFQVGHQMEQILPEYSMMGAAFIQIMIREFGPTICGMMIATRVGSGIAAEIGSMVVTDQVDALRMCNANPLAFLIAPRTVACTLMLILLSAYGVAIATVAGMLVGESSYGISYSTFLNLSLVGSDDLLLGLSKAIAYGAAIPVIAGQSGLNTTGGSEGVGWATTRAVVNTSFAVIVLDFILSAIGYILYSPA